MARDLAGQTNVEAPSAAYPSGRILDDTGAGDGTPVNERVYGDIHQLTMKILREASVVPNDLPDNETDGNQIFQGLTNIFQIRSEKGLANGYAGLDASMFVPLANLPAGVFNVEFVANELSLPNPGVSNRIYVTVTDNNGHRWTGSAYQRLWTSSLFGDWQAFSYETNWGEVANRDARYRLTSGNMVEFRGAIEKSITATGGEQALTLPVGFRPPQARRLPAQPNLVQGGYTFIDINANGELFVQEMGVTFGNNMTSNRFHLDGVSFSLDS